MTDATIQLQVDGSGKLVDNGSFVNAGSTVYRQRTTIGDPSTFSALMGVAATSATGTEFGAFVRVVSGLATVNGTVTANQGSSGSTPWLVIAATSGGSISVSAHSVNQGSSGATPWLVIGATSGGNIPVTGTVNQGTSGSTPWLVISATSGGSPLVKEMRPSTANVTNVAAASSASASVLATNTARISATLFNDTSATAFVIFGATAATSSYTVKMNAGDYYEPPFPCYTGQISAIWAASPAGSMLVTEITS